MADQASQLRAAVLPRFIHQHLMAQLRAQQAAIPVDTGRLKSSLLDGADDIVTPNTVAIVGTDYARYVKTPPLDSRRAIDAAAAQMFQVAGYTPNTSG